MEIIDFLNKIFGAYSMFLLVAGKICCILGFIVCNRIPTNNTFIFLSFMSVANAFALYTWNLYHFLTIYYGINVSNINLLCCKAGYFVQYTSLQIVSWFLVLISVEQYLSVEVKHWRTNYFKPRRAYLTATGLVLFFVALNSHVLFTFGYTREVNGTVTEYCYEPSYMPSVNIFVASRLLLIYAFI
jgi:hypothetical protein